MGNNGYWYRYVGHNDYYNILFQVTFQMDRTSYMLDTKLDVHSTLYFVTVFISRPLLPNQ